MIDRQDISYPFCPGILEYDDSCEIEKEKKESRCADDIGVNLVRGREKDGQYRICQSQDSK